MMKIGGLLLPIISQVTELDESEVDEIKSQLDSVVVKHESDVTALTISGFLNYDIYNEIINSSTVAYNKGVYNENYYGDRNILTVDQQKRALKKLRKSRKEDNDFQYKDYKGHLLVEEVNFIENSDSRIIDEFEITAWYFPWPKYDY